MAHKSTEMPGGCRWEHRCKAGFPQNIDLCPCPHLVQVQAGSLPRWRGPPNAHHRDLLNDFAVKWGVKDIHAWYGGGHVPIYRSYSNYEGELMSSGALRRHPERSMLITAQHAGGKYDNIPVTPIQIKPQIQKSQLL